MDMMGNMNVMMTGTMVLSIVITILQGLFYAAGIMAFIKYLRKPEE